MRRPRGLRVQKKPRRPRINMTQGKNKFKMWREK